MAETEESKPAKDHKELVIRARRRAKVMVDADSRNRELAIEDLRFLHEPGAQWDERVKRERGDQRPTYEFNKTRITVKRVVNDMRANRPAGKVRATEDGDKPTANVLEGLIRNIWANADGDTVIDHAAEYQVGAGMGAWRVRTKYADNEAFDQVIDIDPIRNPFCLYADPGAQDFLKRDAEDWFLTDRISKDAFKTRWPKAEALSFEGIDGFDDDDYWESDDKIRIGEYWYREPYDKTLVLLGNGQTADAEELTPEAIASAGGVLKQRRAKCYRIMMCIIGGGDKLLEGPTEWAGSMFPFVQVYGEYIIIDGKVQWFGLTRFAKDAQRSYNYSRTNAIESVALSPQAKWWATPAQVAGLEASIAEANKKNYPFMLYNPDPIAPGPPSRMASADVPVALVQEMQISSEDIKAVTGIFDASLGAHGNETSGRAINARQRQGEIATFNYMDNMAKGIRRTWEILIDLVPKIYDTERSVRILGIDGSEDYAKVNTIDPSTGQAINDLSRGKYDVAITVGPSFATLRQEAAEAYGEIASRDPNVMMAAGDLVFKAMDLPYAEQIAERYKAILPPPIQQLISKGKELPPEVSAAMAQVQQAQQQVIEHGKLVQAAQMELQEEVAKAKGDKANAQLAQANLKAAEVALQQRENDMKAAEAALADQRTLLAKEVENAILKIENAKLKASHTLEREAHHSDMAHEQAANALGHQQRDLSDAVKDGAQQLQEQHRAVSDAVRDGSQQLKDQQTQLDHKQALARANKPKPKK